MICRQCYASKRYHQPNHKSGHNFDGALPTISELLKHPLFFYIPPRASTELSGRCNYVKTATAFVGVTPLI